MSLEKEAFEKFIQWKESLDVDIGDAQPDWGPWWDCFLAGYKAAKNA